jgi:tRNA1(Val) A37 N6-methylase TrmN6
MDAVLLAHFADVRPGDRVADLGTGTGIIPILICGHTKAESVLGVEIQPEMAEMAERSVRLNGLQDRVEIVGGDVARRFSALGLAAFDAALANPPFFDDPGALRPPSPEKRSAWVADEGLAAWTGFLLKAVREGGTITVIHRADRLADLLALLGRTAGSFQVRPIHAFADEPAKRGSPRASDVLADDRFMLCTNGFRRRDGLWPAPPLVRLLSGLRGTGRGGRTSSNDQHAPSAPVRRPALRGVSGLCAQRVGG